LCRRWIDGVANSILFQQAAFPYRPDLFLATFADQYVRKWRANSWQLLDRSAKAAAFVGVFRLGKAKHFPRLKD
jgi:hypothetical protein